MTTIPAADATSPTRHPIPTTFSIRRASCPQLDLQAPDSTVNDSASRHPASALTAITASEGAPPSGCRPTHGGRVPRPRQPPYSFFPSVPGLVRISSYREPAVEDNCVPLLATEQSSPPPSPSAAPMINFFPQPACSTSSARLALPMPSPLVATGRRRSPPVACIPWCRYVLSAVLLSLYTDFLLAGAHVSDVRDKLNEMPS